MNIDALRDYCLSKPDAEESMPFGPDTLVFKINNKIFLLMALNREPFSFNVKCNPDKALELRETYACVTPGYHMNKKHWNTIVVDGSVPFTLLKEWIDDSHNLVAKKQKS